VGVLVWATMAIAGWHLAVLVPLGLAGVTSQRRERKPAHHAFNRALGYAFAAAWTTFAVFPIGPLLSDSRMVTPQSRLRASMIAVEERREHA
jgi:hypothetical protein